MILLTEKREIERLRSLIESAAKGRFKKVTFFAEGVRTCIFRAEEAKTKCTVAIKILKKNLVDIADEAFRTAVLSNHDHIVRAYDLLWYEDKPLALAMEFIEGPNLRQLLPELHGDKEVAVRIAIHLCEALKKAHEHIPTIVHGNVNPGNILISSPYKTNLIAALKEYQPRGINTDHLWEHVTVKLTGFRMLHREDVQIFKRPGYWPYVPRDEIQQLQESDDVEPDVRWDVRWVAAVLYEMLEGRPPFGEEPKISRTDIPDLKEIVDKGLAKDPANRYQTMSEMLCRLEVFQWGDAAFDQVDEKITQKYSDDPIARSAWGRMLVNEGQRTLGADQTELESNRISHVPALLHEEANEAAAAEAVIQEKRQLNGSTASSIERDSLSVEGFSISEGETLPTQIIDSKAMGGVYAGQNPEKPNQEKDKDYTDLINKLGNLSGKGRLEHKKEAGSDAIKPLVPVGKNGVTTTSPERPCSGLLPMAIKPGTQNWRGDHAFRWGRISSVVLFLVAVILFTVFVLPQFLLVKQQWEWAKIIRRSDHNRSFFIELEGFLKREAKFRLKSNRPELFPCQLQFQITPERTDGFSVEDTWFEAIEHRLRLPEGTPSARIEEHLILYVHSLSLAESLPLVLSLEKVPYIANPSLGEAFFGKFVGKKKSFAGTIAISMAVARNIGDPSPDTWLPIGTFDYVVEFSPGIRFR